MDLKSKFVNKWTKIRLCPICAFFVHHVTELFNEQSMCVINWLPSNVFMKIILAMQQNGVRFISFFEAYSILKHDYFPLNFRFKKYAVITFDDGYASIKEILPWLKEKLFLLQSSSILHT